eukprot:TRINITY_DN29353_c0_g1_i1.p1 TRINITY_DN29353_c0_g1~~TRINITY_DN29353_c0_g1_i1.p1  ORF type:complete len:403 (+),score=44.73 TRINITY_DN29353_c0_g1_i1:87-1295(+)
MPARALEHDVARVLNDPTAEEEGLISGGYRENGDPYDDEIGGKFSDNNSRRGVRRRCAVVSLGLGLMLFITYSMFAGTNCMFGTQSMIPFSLVTIVPGRYGGAMVLAVLASVTALFYPIAVSRKPRPHFLHVAGSYLLLNAVTACCMVITVWAGCAKVGWIRSPTALMSLLGFSACFVLLQYSILVKVEALDVNSTEEDLARAPLRRLYHMMLNPCTLGIGLLTAVIPLGVIDYGGPLWNTFVFCTAGFIMMFLTVMVSFTLVAVKQMLGCLSELSSAQLSTTAAKKRKLRNHLAMHAAATLLANMFSVLFLGSASAVIFKVVSESTMFTMYGLYVSTNTICALTLSGLTGAVCRPGGGVADDDSVSAGAPRGPVQQLEEAGQAVQGRSAQEDQDEMLEPKE